MARQASRQKIGIAKVSTGCRAERSAVKACDVGRVMFDGGLGRNFAAVSGRILIFEKGLRNRP